MSRSRRPGSGRSVRRSASLRRPAQSVDYHKETAAPAIAADGLPPLREVIRRHGLRADKRLGQNFLMDLNLTRRIARAAGPFDDIDLVLEIGPGPGGLTRALLMEGAPKVVAIERDERPLAALQEIAAHYPGRLEVIHGDALTFDAISAFAGRRVRVAANLPYNIGTRLLVRWLTDGPWPPWWRSLTLMFQQEVAERITARPGDAAYGSLSVLTRWRTDARILFRLPAHAFTPSPKVASALVRIEPRTAVEPEISCEDLESVLRPAFAQRRKMLRRTLASISDDPQALLRAAGIAPTARAEELDVEDFARLALLRSRA
ncbi:MAG: 16S rRNA (adenine(1518)-N(6)/adenine(1519)-N(6))-dimethyltransferase RsmA [Alphaproteobacteria bacterium]|nr:MAG: 16S rRNA (adenine(1518)-N(6)/adenine(1519)-N(6))-dimethyltransferase RsmA [Alphaproteobacteria bacterium]